jgi:uncharacterized membrane protein
MSIVGILVIGLVSYTVNMPKLAIVQFQVSITCDFAVADLHQASSSWP